MRKQNEPGSDPRLLINIFVERSVRKFRVTFRNGEQGVIHAETVPQAIASAVRHQDGEIVSIEEWRTVDVKPKRGRPPTSRGAYNELPGRKFGRVSDSDWQEIRNAVDASGLSLVQWALPMMLQKARREAQK